VFVLTWDIPRVSMRTPDGSHLEFYGELFVNKTDLNLNSLLYEAHPHGYSGRKF